MRLKQSKEHQQALAEISDAYRTLIGLPPDLVQELSDSELIHYLRLNWSPERCEILATLLKEEGDNLSALGNQEKSIASYLKSISLFLEASPKYDQISDLLAIL